MPSRPPSALNPNHMPFPQDKVIHSGWKKEILDLVRASSRQIDIINPFLQLKTTDDLFSSFSGPIRVLTRFNVADFYTGVSDLEALDLLLQRGVRVRGIRNLHAKVYSFDRACSLVCSANLTDAAMRRNLEIGLITSSPGPVGTLAATFDKLWDAAGPDLVRELIEAWRHQIRTAKLKAPSYPSLGLRDFGAVVDLTAPDLAKAAGGGLSFISSFRLEDAQNYFCKFSASSSKRPPRSKPIAEWIKDCDFVIGGFYPNGKRPRKVRDGDVMFPAVLTSNPNETFIIGRAYAFRYVQGDDDATPDEMAVLHKEWKKDWPHMIRFRDSEFLDGSLSDGVSLSSLMAKFENDSFVTSQERAKTDPKFVPQRSVKQQAAVRLTDEAAAWVNAQLDDRFRSLGRVRL